MFRIVHVSDLHVLSASGVEWRRMLFNKRITGHATGPVAASALAIRSLEGKRGMLVTVGVAASGRIRRPLRPRRRG